MNPFIEFRASHRPGALQRWAWAAGILAWAWTRSGTAAQWSEDFARQPDPAQWSVWGDGSFYQWDSAQETLGVTWDSRQTNTFFHRALGTVLTTNDNFSFGFDLRLRDITPGVSTNRGTFEIAVGLVNRRDAFQTNFFRGAGQTSNGPRNLVEFDYFPASGAITATFSPTAASTNTLIQFSDNHPLAFPLNSWLRFGFVYTAASRTLRTQISLNGAPFGKAPDNSIRDLVLVNDFRVDAFAVSSYSEAGQPKGFGGSVLAHGDLDNVYVTTPPAPVGPLAGGFSNLLPHVEFASLPLWQYSLERSTNLIHWIPAAPAVAGPGGILRLRDPAPPAARAFHRVRAERP